MLTLLLRQGRRFGLERICERRHLDLVIVVVGELQPKVDKMEDIEVTAIQEGLRNKKPSTLHNVLGSKEREIYALSSLI